VTEPRQRLIDATAAALHIKDTYGVVVAPATIRSWARRRRIGNYGAGRTGAHFDLDEIDAFVRKRLGRGDVAS
jgi:hypothetical protein